MRYQNEWLLLEADDMVDEMEHRQPTEEFLFYEAVMSGDVESVRKNCEQERFMDDEGVGVLSQDPVTNLKYHFVITTAMITRLCRQRGMELEQAFRMSDFYIQSLDRIHTLQEIQHLHDEMVLDYTEKMRRICRSDTGSRHINVCKEYIYAHIKERITIEEIAEQLGVSASYLSRLFKKETGDSVSAYIRAQKIEMAKNMLRYSEYPLSDIANRLSFSSQSHFIQQFKEQTGMTPKKYRDMNHMVHWDIGTGGGKLYRAAVTESVKFHYVLPAGLLECSCHKAPCRLEGAFRSQTHVRPGFPQQYADVFRGNPCPFQGVSTSGEWRAKVLCHINPGADRGFLPRSRP